jgi:hypothetical protein
MTTMRVPRATAGSKQVDPLDAPGAVAPPTKVGPLAGRQLPSTRQPPRNVRRLPAQPDKVRQGPASGIEQPRRNRSRFQKPRALAEPALEVRSDSERFMGIEPIDEFAEFRIVLRQTAKRLPLSRGQTVVARGTNRLAQRSDSMVLRQSCSLELRADVDLKVLKFRPIGGSQVIDLGGINWL